MSELSLFTYVTDSITSNDYYTPKFIFDAIGLEFDIDVAAPLQGIPWIPCKRWFSQADDGLSQDWSGALVWMNPPFSKPGPWVDKFIQNGNGVALICTSKAKWYKQIWDQADGLLTVDSSFKFIRPDDVRSDIYMPTVLVSMGAIATAALVASNLGRVRL